jgi:hypothetical protein
MSVGLTTTKGDADQRAGGIALDVRSVMDRVRIFKTWLDTVTVTQLEGLGYTTGEANTLKSAFTDLDKLRTIYEGTATQGTTYDFRTFSKLLTGVV